MSRETESMETIDTTTEFNEKQVAIITAAEKLISTDGFAGTSVRDIAHEAGVNVAMISYYFGSKEKLLEAIFEYRTSIMRIKVENLIQNEHLTHIEKVNVLIDDYVEKFMHQQDFHKIVIREQLIERDTVIASLILELKKRNLVSIKKLISDGQKAGAFKKNIDVGLMMSTMVGTVSHMISSNKFYREINHLEHLTEEEFQKHMKKKLSFHLKNLFKLVLTYES